MTTYSEISPRYNELYGDEQLEKAKIIKDSVKLKPLVLDVGCGTGIVDFGVNTIGLDPSIGLLRLHPGLKVCAKAENLPFKDKSFGSVVSLTALHHTDITQAIKEIRRVAKPKATFAFSILKKSKDFRNIVSGLHSNFDIKAIDDDKDLILVSNITIF